MSYRDILKDRFEKAEGQVLKDRPQEKPKKIRWFRTRCPACDHVVEYSPKEDWDGRLTCPQCQHSFRLVLLDHFSIEYEEEKDDFLIGYSQGLNPKDFTS